MRAPPCLLVADVANDDIAAHLEFYRELGIDGVRLEPEWRARQNAGPVRQPDAGDVARAVADQPAAPQGATPQTDAGPGAGRPERAEVGLPSMRRQDPDTAPAALYASSADALQALRVHIGPDCSRCKLHTLGRRQVVFGVGNPNADLMFVGEAPGADEDVQGEPFVGSSGQLLTKIIGAIGLTRDDVYIANVIKCRPPGNRNPEPDEVEQCEPFLFRQVDIVKPKVIVALGKFAAQCLLKTDSPITRIRGREFAYRDAVLIPTFHPSYLLRNPSAKRDVWDDMKRVRAILNEGS